MAGTYELWYTTDKGVRLCLLDNTLGFTASRTVNKIGYLEMSLPATFDEALLKRDRMVQVWRAPAGGRLRLWRVYLLRRWRLAREGSDERISLYGVDSNDLLRRRVVAHYAGSSNAIATAEEADDLMKRIVTDAETDGTNPAPTAGTRAWSNFSVAGDLTDGPQLTKDFAWKRLLEYSGTGVLPDLAQAAKETGTEVFFDVVANSVSATSITFQFRTYTGQPGMDVSDRVVFDEQRGNLKDPWLEWDYSDEITYCYSGGKGEEAEREIQQVYDAGRYLASQWNRCEAFADARNQTAANGVREAGRALLKDGEPVQRFGGIPLDTTGTRFGLDWDFGYKVRARYRNTEFDAIIRSVVLGVDESGQETIEARLEYES